MDRCQDEIERNDSDEDDGAQSNHTDVEAETLDTAEEDESQHNQAIVSDLISRAKTLLSELEVLRNRLRDLKQEGSVEIAHYRGVVSSEVGMLERLSAQPSTKASAHIARSSNLPFLENVWSNAKKSKSLVALQKRIFFNQNWHDASSIQFTSVAAGRERGKKKKGKKEDCVIVDSITEGGRIWTKVSLVTNTRVVFDLAKQGWDSGGSDDEEGFVAFSMGENDDQDRDIPLLKTAKELMRAASKVRVRTRQPEVHLILPRVKLGLIEEVDEIVEKCQKTGAIVFCGEDLTPEPSLVEALQAMVPNPMQSFSEILNIDCTILLALVSDFSHARVTKEPWFHRALQRQVEIEDNENLLPSLLYPALGSHEMVCTEEAAKRMREIVATIGTPSEKARTALMMGDDEAKTRQHLLEEMQQWSAYPVPSHWALPIKVVSKDEDDCTSTLPSQAVAAAEELTAINQSVFLYGWASRRTTITSNRIVVKQIEKKLDEYQNLDDAVWPKIWLCPTARSLVGKEKRGAKKDEKKDGAWPLPDPLRREHQRRNGLDVLSQRAGHEVEDLRPEGYPSDEVIAAKLEAASIKNGTNGAKDEQSMNGTPDM